MRAARSLLVAVFTLAVCVACRSHSGAASLGEVPVVAPFDAMGLPTKGGVVWSCNVVRMKVVYDGGDKGELGESYGQALEQHGWKSMQPAAAGPHQWLGRYQHAGEVLTLDVHDADFEGKVPNGVEVFLSIKDAI